MYIYVSICSFLPQVLYKVWCLSKLCALKNNPKTACEKERKEKRGKTAMTLDGDGEWPDNTRL
jgi:hypothetical protein